MTRYLMALFGSILFAQDANTIRVPVRLVTAPTLVFSKQRKLIFGLQASDFRLYDNGRLQKVSLDIEWAPLSLVVVIQSNEDVRDYLAFIDRAGSVIDTSLVGEDGEAAVLTYNDQVGVKKGLEVGDVRSALADIKADGEKARMIDAGLCGIALLKEHPRARTRVLLFIGQPIDRGSSGTVAMLRDQADRENVSVYAIALPQFGKKFVSDTFSLSGLGSQGTKGGYEARMELTKMVPAVRRRTGVALGKDPFSQLTAATGGTQLHVRKQGQLEDAIDAVGAELHSMYLLSFSPDLRENGYHEIRVDVDVPSATAYSRPGYTLTGN